MIKLTESPRPKAENIVPMVNVAFLLLIFFLMTAVIAPQDPVAIDPPKGTGIRDVSTDVTLFLEADGTLSRGDHFGGALDGLTGLNVELRVARELSGQVLAKVLQETKRAGAKSTNLVVALP